ncbi:RNase3 domain-containing protein [Xylariaceae sp. FL0255]|nr:RNase3 domain-containing protein [Xylariaceae sp. FL0255]
MDLVTEPEIVISDGYDSSTTESSSSIELGHTPKETGFSANVVEDVTTTKTKDQSAVDQPGDQTTIHARAYQMEMFEESLRRNIIVAMDTGSGKTQVAVLRIKAELDKSSDKLIWFLAPTVTLCEQQHRVLKSQIPAAQIKLLSGTDDVDSWSDQRIWDDFLKGVHIVVSTFQVLLDAITHAFVKLSSLSLIVIDEAHNCVGKHPGKMIMDRYHVQKSIGAPVPAILGLTASPIMNSHPDSLERIESALDAICRTPTLHRSELISRVNPPVLICIPFIPSQDPPLVDSLASLTRALNSLDLFDDPYVLYLRGDPTESNKVRLRKVLEKRNTYSIKQMESLCRKSFTIGLELGAWATEYFIYMAVTHFLDMKNPSNLWTESWTVQERLYLASALKTVKIRMPDPLETTPDDLTDKFHSLAQILTLTPEDTIGIIFVNERATVAVLRHLLSVFPSTRDRFQLGSVMGSSNYAPRKRDLWDYTLSRDTLDLEAFRAGNLNLLVATTILEEGIDVPACNLVVCFDEPPNLKSFIQRRGRARMKRSRLVLLTQESSQQHKTWAALEKEMKRKYEDDMRTLAELVEIEDEKTNGLIPPLCIPSTGASLGIDQAKAHLEHFCTKITSKQYVDHRPYYIELQEGSFENGQPRIKATVVLPISLPPHLRRIEGSRHWQSEKSAFKDAAFEAFKAVYDAGLLNDNFMPLRDEFESVEKCSSMMDADELWSPWPRTAHLWDRTSELVQRKLLLKDQGKVMCEFEATLPSYFPAVPEFPIFWDTENTWTVEISADSTVMSASSLKPDQSAALLDLALGNRFSVENAAHIMHLQSSYDIQFRRDAGRLELQEHKVHPDFLVRDQFGHPYLFDRWLTCRPDLREVRGIARQALEEPIEIPWVALKKLPKRNDFLRPIHPISQSAPTGKRYHRISPAFLCTIDSIDRFKVQFGTIIPSIIQRIGVYLAAEELSNTILKEVNFSDLSLIVTATAARAAHESTDYERLEFLGDSILKLLATLSVMAQYPKYPEGYLSAKKDLIVSNSRLCRATMESGLDKFIRAGSSKTSKWRPLYIKNFLPYAPPPAEKREVSSKTLADVIESLIGAAHQDGGMAKALSCLKLFLPDCEWHDLPEARAILSQGQTVTTKISTFLELFEQLVGYSFTNKATLEEAVTHASWNPGSYTDQACMERLEFLGDSILDTIIVSALWTHTERELSNQEMHLLRVACVNADLLGFMVMEWHISQEETHISPEDKTTLVTETELPFWKFMRHNSGSVSAAQENAEKRHTAERDRVLAIMASETGYPWAELAHLDMPKFFSDMFESVIGAVWMDSGSIKTCTEIVERVGILPYLRHVLAHNIDVRHPKNKLGELAGRDRKTVCYESETRYENGIANLLCRVFVDEELVVEINSGVNPLEAQTRAADAAYRILIAEAADKMGREMAGSGEEEGCIKEMDLTAG